MANSEALSKYREIQDLKGKLKSLKLLKSEGFKVPNQLIDLVQQELWQLEGVLTVWQCSNCKTITEAHVKILEIWCDCGKGVVKKIWNHPTAVKQ